MKKKIVSFTLSKESIKRINKASKSLGISRSEYLDFLIIEIIPISKEVEATLDKIEALQKEAREMIKARSKDIKHEEER